MKKLDVANSLTTYFINIYFKRFGKKAVVNRGKLKFGLAEMLEDWSKTEIQKFLDYYVKTENEPDLADFCRRYDEIIREMKLEENDKRVRRQLMDETRDSVMKFREQFKRDAKRD